MIRITLFLIAITLSALSGLRPAEAGVIFTMTGSCQGFCGSTGQNPGDTISGFVEFDNFDAAANGAYLVPVNYYLVFGNVVLTTGITDTYLREGYDTFQKIDDDHIGPGDFRVWSAISNVTLIFLGNCYGCAADRWAYGFAPGSYGDFQFTREGGSEVPAPGAALLLAGAALGLAGLVRRRR